MNLKKEGRVFKTAYLYQLVLYTYIIHLNQKTYPKCFLQDLNGNKFEVEITEQLISEIFKRAVELKTKINKYISEFRIDQLAVPNKENCTNCDYRPVCNQYKVKFINNFENKRVDICGEVVEIMETEKMQIKIVIENIIHLVKGITTMEKINIGDTIYVYNLFCPDGDLQILYAMKQTTIKH